MAKELPKAYNPQEHEQKIYKMWESSGAFAPDDSRFTIQKVSLRATSGERGNLGTDCFGLPRNDKSASKIRNSTKKRERFVVVMPPPNVTGTLHIGHALFATLQDIMTRYHRLKGEETLYLPGTDHAGIATQSVVEKDLAKQGIRRRDLGREKFVEKVWQWKEHHHERITKQLRAMGVSADWSREAFTLDEKRSAAVNAAFKKLYDKGLIYQGYYLVNWCPKCGTAIADDEVEHEEQKAPLYYFKYDKKFPIAIATTRPETKLGDSAVAVHPDDRRYREYIGQTLKANLDGTKLTVKIIADKAVDKDFGTGAVGVTPAHANTDWQLAEKHHLEKIKIIDEHGRMTGEAGGRYAGLTTAAAREKVIEYLKNQGLLEKEETIDHSLSVCYRCHRAIEPLPSLQWFVKMKPLAAKALAAVRDGKVNIIPKRFEKVYIHWLENIRDWCISRQLWWGHRIPVWHRNSESTKSEYRNPKQAQNSNVSNLKNLDLDIVSNLELRASDLKSDNVYVGITPPEGVGWIQEDDVLDTWFSSSLWPFSTMGWPDEEAPDFKKYYPTSVLETGYDIIFFWVARMIMMGLELTGQAPFNTVYLHGMVRDEQGRKMSKSLGNVVEPLTLIDQWGTDAVRLALVIGTTPGNDVNFAASRAKGYRNFANKIWNAGRFVLTRMDPVSLRGLAKQSDSAESSRACRGIPSIPEPTSLSLIYPERSRRTPRNDKDAKILKEFALHKQKVTKLLEEYRFSQAGDELYHWFWHRFADVIIEESKERLEEGGDGAKAASVLLWHLLRDQLIMLHPFMPFVTEAIWQEVPLALRRDKMLITAAWPEPLNNKSQAPKIK